MARNRCRRSWTSEQITQLRSEIIFFVKAGYSVKMAKWFVANKYRIANSTAQQIYYGTGAYEKFGEMKQSRIPVCHPTRRGLPSGYTKGKISEISEAFEKCSAKYKKVSPTEEETTLKTLVANLKKKYGITSITF